MLLLWTSLLITTAACHRVYDSTENTDPDKNTTTLYPVSNATQSSEETKTPKPDVTSWKIETNFAESKLAKDNNSTDSKEELVVEKTVNASKEFKPSPHIGFFDEVEPTRETYDFTPVLKKPPSGFINFPEEPQNKIPKDALKNYIKFPYKIESAIFAKTKPSWLQTMDSRPTAEVPVKLPAGGLYQLPDPFKEKPSNEEFGLEFSSDVKENAVKKRPNPWKKLMHLITALIPVGILVSALTPNIITLHSTGTGPGSDYPSSNIFRRADAASQLPAISERCRRRLLCELHSERNYALKARQRGRPCHRLPCEDPEALAKSLSWLLAYHQPGPDGNT